MEKPSAELRAIARDDERAARDEWRLLNRLRADLVATFPTALAIAGEIGEHVEQFDTPNSLQCYAGKAPVTRRSGKSELVVATRLACNRYLAAAVQQWAFCSLRQSGWARDFYDAQRGRGKTHHAALRALGNRWLEVLWHCLTEGVLYDEATHVAYRNRYLTTTPATAAA